jgi:hypothetical protein
VTDASSWRRCSACKKPIALGAVYWTCNVSTCNRKRTGLVFCTVTCWEVHLPGANHRESWAVEQRAPSTPDASPASAGSSSASSGRRRLLQDAAASPRSEPSREVLIVASRLKDYVRLKSGFNTSEGVLAPLSDVVRRVCDDAIRNATREGRRTILDRDVPKS